VRATVKHNIFAALVLLAVVIMYGDVAEKVSALSAENERLRLFNARRERRIIKPPASPRDQSIGKASHILGTPAEVIRAIWQQENGPPDIETGSIGKTDHFAKHFEMDDWAALEAARTINRLSFNWFLHTPEGRIAYKRMLNYAAPTYAAMGPAQNAQWAKSVYGFSLTKSAK